jgi:aspartyl-tRNA(Asn)/glutamyl-tRNA(Gln) amidotransferase subunit B
VRDYGLSRYDAFVLGAQGSLAHFFEAAAGGADAKLTANWTMGEYLAYINAAGLEPGHGHVTPARLAALVGLIADGAISGSAAKQVFALMVEERAEPQEIVARHGLGQISDEGALAKIVAQVVADNPAQAEQFRAGKEQLLGYFVGNVMKATQGRANPKLVNDLLRKALGS